MTQDRIPLDAGSSRPDMEGEIANATRLDERGLKAVEAYIGKKWFTNRLADAIGAVRAYLSTLPPAPAVEGVEPVAWVRAWNFQGRPCADEFTDSSELAELWRGHPQTDEVRPLYPASALSRLVKERDETLDALYEAQRQPWPEWANEIRECLEGYGVDPGDEWNVAEQFEEWLAGCVENETRRAEAAEASVARLTTLLAEARADPTTEQVERALVAWHDILSIKNRPRSEFWRMFAAISAARRYQQKREAK